MGLNKERPQKHYIPDVPSAKECYQCRDGRPEKIYREIWFFFFELKIWHKNFWI